jgi:hypothetical protein
VNDLLRELPPGVRDALGNGFVDLYIVGSMAVGGFDRDSDVDVVATEEEVSGALFQRLDAMHRRIAALPSWCATRLESDYVDRRTSRRFDTARARGPRLGQLDQRWLPLLDRAWEGRAHPDRPSPLEDVRDTVALLCLARKADTGS